MRFKEFASYLERLETTPKRLEITDILVELIGKLTHEETPQAVYLSLGYLKAPFENRVFNMADRQVVKILQALTKEDVARLYAELGDLGSVAKNVLTKNIDNKYSVTEIYGKLLEIASIEGLGSVDLKMKKTTVLLNSVDSLSAKFITRIILGTVRLGFTELTVITALAIISGDKKLAEKIERVYNEHPDIGLIAQRIKESGIAGLKKIDIEPGVPVLSQKAQRVSGMEEAFERIPNVWAEFKFDGTRVQLHMDRNKKAKTGKGAVDLFGEVANKFLMKTYTRNLEETTHQYPDLLEAADKQIKADSIILDGEAIGFNRETGAFLPFQETIQRKRKHGVTEAAKNIPLKYFVFDILYLNGKSTTELPLRERKKILRNIIAAGDTIIVDDDMETESFEKLVEYFEIAKEKGLEGLIVKNPDDNYQAGARSYSWIKLKKADEKLLDDSVDCVLLGYYHGRGVRSKFGIGGFLVGVMDKDAEVFKTVTKVGTGLTDEEWVKIKKLADKHKTKTVPKNVLVEKTLLPDVIIEPMIVLEIGADEISVSQNHTSGYALRFPRLIKFREDKNPSEATTLKEIELMFKKQRGKV
ncbi:MAG: putative DNA ligase [candidate division WWE3 bacterium GW2011_GWF2_41_45]|uniref:DNA ligase n=2 Tax=Katanobacteria TaxID=422282 RepID=A0A1F4W3Q1_UNCKA|nr:MAG: putative DNA ligase [candidate division WWE3 bacterium GW2011_GWC2_41_23]KKS09968.1 MAG: putative DNA ligase [candidate division WWE3 bacterium GW2011_GWF2_41_45]KKS19798.1 MAG: putative DNA ligase [candidate division WWE3 bacterium GW2011_GWE1_41_72]KKS27215.1 MAG: ATP-dependent DNA ligase I, DNA ligase 1 [candidate division WWE3 bacterium GW2011_GWC1_42_102]KKS30242.1 MAG: putative DNA ligase [candidate division WWE3 bacterium GW2011_GWD2_42_11]KKS50842.1 MAG: putative DNA ligase [ca